jgi:DNA invertase Pin-like site-specific DNA recombinase
VSAAYISDGAPPPFERELIRARTGDGIKRAKAAGVHMGRPSKLSKHQQREALARLARGDETLVEIARTYNVSHMTISRLKRDWREPA